MDVDQAYQSMDTGSISYFDLSPDVFAWRGSIPEKIESRRVEMSDLLLFDILLSSGGISEPHTLYPPYDVPSLRRLLHAIENCKYDALKRECLVYFLLKWYNDGREERFKFEKGIPPQFAALADAYWDLDTGINVECAVSVLSDARINKDYASKILQAISLSENPMPLVLKYIRTVKPSLIEPADLDLYVVALVNSSLLEAWQFQRTFPEQNPTRPRLIRKILEWCLSPKPRPHPLTQLLAFPFSPYEQRLIHEYALNPPAECAASSIPVIQDLVCVRLIQSGQHAAAIKLDRQFSAASSSKVSPKLKKAIQDRRLMMDEIMATMPAVERDLLEAELEIMAKGKKGGAPVTASSSAESFGSKAGPGDLTMSWEEVQPIRPVIDRPNLAGTGVPTPVPGALPSPERSGAPRFGSGFPLISSGSLTNAPQNPFVPLQKNIFAAPPTSSQSQPSTSTPHHRLDLSSSRAPAGSSGLSFPPGLFAQSSSTHPSKPVLTPASLFGSAGSANKTRTTFPKLPAINGKKRVFSQDTSPPQRPAVNQQQQPVEDNDMNIDSEDDIVHRLRPRENDDTRNNDGEEVGLSFSVFSASGNNAAGPARQKTTRSGTKSQTLPGSFLSESEDEGEVTRNNRRRRTSPPPQQQPPKQPRNVRVPKAAVGGTNLGRSLPGSLMVEEEEEAEAEVDDVAPLPASKRPARKGRTSRAGSYDGQGDSIQPRRSTRLSTAPSATSSSPESSPKKAPSKPRKSTRTPTVGAGTVKSGTRKKR